MGVITVENNRFYKIAMTPGLSSDVQGEMMHDLLSSGKNVLENDSLQEEYDAALEQIRQDREVTLQKIRDVAEREYNTELLTMRTVIGIYDIASEARDKLSDNLIADNIQKFMVQHSAILSCEALDQLENLRGVFNGMAPDQRDRNLETMRHKLAAAITTKEEHHDEEVDSRIDAVKRTADRYSGVLRVFGAPGLN